MELILGASAMSRDLGLVAACAHVTPASSPRRRAIDEEKPAAGIGAHTQPRRRVIGEELGERGGDGCPRLVESVADLGEGVTGPIRIALDLVVMQPMPEDVVEVTKLIGRGMAVLGHLGRDAVQERAEVVEPFNATRGLIGIASKVGRFDREATSTDQSPLAEPGQQRGDVGEGLNGLATLVLERVPERNEELLGLVGLRKRSTIECHVTIVQRLTSYSDPGTVSL
jgi:hypothetical protein